MTSRQEVIAVIRIGKSLYQFQDSQAAATTKRNPEQAYPFFFKAIKDFVRDEHFFKEVMSVADFA